MMKRKAWMVMLGVVMLVVLAAGGAQAAWYTCTVNQAGTSGAAYFMNITDTAATPAFSNQYFFIQVAGQEKSMLAALLTAWSTGGKVQVWLDGTGAWFTSPAITVSN